jgi:FKBP-type peptidyl-prolyl cis-trans isomerase 2
MAKNETSKTETKENTAEASSSAAIKKRNGTKVTPKIALSIALVVAVLAIAYVAFSGASTTVVQNGDIVEVNYTGSFTNGTIFDASSYHGGPFNFTVGANQVIQGFDQAVIGMSVGQEKNVTIPVNEAYGPVNRALFIQIPTNVLRGDLNAAPVVGMGIKNSAGEQGVITAVNSTNVTVDFNSPLAGKVLVFRITIVGIKKA